MVVLQQHFQGVDVDLGKHSVVLTSSQLYVPKRPALRAHGAVHSLGITGLALVTPMRQSVSSCYFCHRCGGGVGKARRNYARESRRTCQTDWGLGWRARCARMGCDVAAQGM